MKIRIPLLILPAAAAPQLAAAQTVVAPDLGGSLLQMLLGLGAVLLLLFASLYLIKRLAAPRGAAAGLLRIVAGTAVGTRERVVVVEVGDTWLVLGVAPGRVTPLTQLPRQEVPASKPLPGKDFAGWLTQILDRRNAR